MRVLGLLGGVVVGAVGLVGVAAMNPLLPHSDQTEATTDVAVPAADPAGADDSLPAAGDGDQISRPNADVAALDAPEGGDDAPETDAAALRGTRAGQVDPTLGSDLNGDLEAPDLGDLAADAPQIDGGSPASGLSPSDTDSLDVVTTPAAPLQLAQPDDALDDLTPEAQTPGTGGQTALIVVPDADQPPPQGGLRQPVAPLVTSGADDDAPAGAENSTAPGLGQRAGTFATTPALVDAEDETPNLAASDEDTLSTPDVQADLGALGRNAVAFAGTGKPRISIVLLDLGAEGLPVETLAKLQFPVSVAVQLGTPGAAEQAVALHDAGLEVLAMAPLATLRDSDLVLGDLGGVTNALPHAVGLIDHPSARVFGNRSLLAGVIEDFGQSGHGLISFAQGLNPVPALATAQGVANIEVARILDARGEDGAAIARYLDRAVLDAGQGGHLVMFSSTRRETVLAVVNWSLSARARAVDLAPVSAGLKASMAR